ncbi:MAG: Gfo/Idh/MocA family oxidoreductase [Kiritimatiellaeota bacterium]|nr:Gfo/Idh/MocA family oxidoreductase [Kiritimatiellota bacterium]
MAKKTSVVIVGAGRFARAHTGHILGLEDARIAGFVEPSAAAREAMAEFIRGAGRKKVPPFFDTLEAFLAARGPADCALIVTPHNLHAAQCVACMKAGMDVLVEKPMAPNAAEARRVIRARDETGRALSVAYTCGYSPALAKAREIIAAGEIGRVLSVAGVLIQPWTTHSAGTWRQDPEASCGGFLYDTGSHAFNVMAELAGAEARELFAAERDNRGAPVDVASVVAGRFANGVPFTLCAEGGAANAASRVTVAGSAGVLVMGVWGEFLRVMRPGEREERPVEFPVAQGLFGQFLRVRRGDIPNPCPAEAGLRFAKFMDMVRAKG